MRSIPSHQGRWRSFLSLLVDAQVGAYGIWTVLVDLCESVAMALLSSTNMAPFVDRDLDNLRQSIISESNRLPTMIKERPEEDNMTQQDHEEDQPEDLAVAVELKFLLPLLVQGETDPTPRDPRPPQVIPREIRRDEDACREQAYEAIASTIQRTGLNATTIQAISTHNLTERQFWDSAWIVKRANSAEPGPEEIALSGRYVWVSVEISSPKMRARDPATRRDMEQVLVAINEEHRLAANYTCEVHVHLGRMDGRPFSLHTLKRLGSLLWAAEPTLRSIRNPKSPNYDNVYTWGSEIRRFSRLAKAASETDERFAPLGEGEIEDSQVRSTLLGQISYQDRVALHKIWGTDTHLDLGRLLSGPVKQHRRLGFNFSAFGLEDDRAHRSPRTIEFRMMEGTVRSDLILNWVSICARIGEVAVLRSDGRFVGALRRLLGVLDQQHPTGRDHDETLGRRRGREFRGLMQDLEVPRAAYAGFEDKVIREH